MNKNIIIVILLLISVVFLSGCTDGNTTGEVTKVGEITTTTTKPPSTTIITPTTTTTMQPTTTTTTTLPQKDCSDFGYFDYCYNGFTCQTIKPTADLTCCQCVPIQTTTTTSTTLPSTTTTTTSITTTTTMPTGSWNSVVTFSGSTYKGTDSFYIPGNKWRFTWSCESSSQYDGLSIFAYPEGETAIFVASISMAKCSQGPDTYTVYEGPGNYYFNIHAANLEGWSINVESYH